MKFTCLRVSLVLTGAALILAGCDGQAKIHRTLRSVGAKNLRDETLAVCREGFRKETSTKIETERWPDSIRAFHPLGLWAEPDGAYILIDSDPDGERGIYLPRIFSEKDPLCSPTLKHVKLGEAVYWYDKKR
jgi:hypothetical protein